MKVGELGRAPQAIRRGTRVSEAAPPLPRVVSSSDDAAAFARSKRRLRLGRRKKRDFGSAAMSDAARCELRRRSSTWRRWWTQTRLRAERCAPRHETTIDLTADDATRRTDVTAARCRPREGGVEHARHDAIGVHGTRAFARFERCFAGHRRQSECAHRRRRMRRTRGRRSGLRRRRGRRRGERRDVALRHTASHHREKRRGAQDVTHATVVTRRFRE